MKAEFYLRDIENHDKDGNPVLHKDVLHFALERAAHGGPHAPPTAYDNIATKEHVANYRDAFKVFRAKHPLFKIKWPELDVQVEASAEEAAPEKKAKAKKGE